MTFVTETSNGHGTTADRVRQLWRPGMTPTEVGRQLDIPRKTAAYHVRKLEAVGGNPAAKREPAAAAKPAATRPARPRQPAAKPRRDLVKDVGVVVVAAVMLAISYDHIVHLALLAGFGWGAWAMPLPLDGMAIVSLRHMRHERRYWVAWAGLFVGLGGSLAANMISYDPSLAKMQHVGLAFAALPPLAAAVCWHLFDRGNREGR